MIISMPNSIKLAKVRRDMMRMHNKKELMLISMLKWDTMGLAHLPIFPVTSQTIRHLRLVCNKTDIDVRLLRMPRMRMMLQSSQKVKFGSMTMMRTGRLVRQDNHAKRVLSSIVTSRERPDWSHGRRLKVRMSGNWQGG